MLFRSTPETIDNVINDKVTNQIQQASKTLFKQVRQELRKNSSGEHPRDHMLEPGHTYSGRDSTNSRNNYSSTTTSHQNNQRAYKYPNSRYNNNYNSNPSTYNNHQENRTYPSPPNQQKQQSIDTWNHNLQRRQSHHRHRYYKHR